jgi:hypothetical protein
VRFADAIVRFAPKQLVLNPGESQVVRVMVNRPADLAPGEYRSHLVFQNVPRKDAPNAVTSGKGRARAAVKSLYGISIPVIYRLKTRPAAVEISDVRFYADEASRPVMAVTAVRSGDESVYGDLKVSYRAPGAKTFSALIESNGNSIYPPLERRVFALPAAKPASGGTLRVEYGDNDKVFAKKELEVR